MQMRPCSTHIHVSQESATFNNSNKGITFTQTQHEPTCNVDFLKGLRLIPNMDELFKTLFCKIQTSIVYYSRYWFSPLHVRFIPYENIKFVAFVFSFDIAQWYYWQCFFLIETTSSARAPPALLIIIHLLEKIQHAPPCSLLGYRPLCV